MFFGRSCQSDENARTRLVRMRPKNVKSLHEREMIFFISVLSDREVSFLLIRKLFVFCHVASIFKYLQL